MREPARAPTAQAAAGPRVARVPELRVRAGRAVERVPVNALVDVRRDRGLRVPGRAIRAAVPMRGSEENLDAKHLRVRAPVNAPIRRAARELPEHLVQHRGRLGAGRAKPPVQGRN